MRFENKVAVVTGAGGGAIVNPSSSADWMGAGHYGSAKLASHAAGWVAARTLAVDGGQIMRI